MSTIRRATAETSNSFATAGQSRFALWLVPLLIAGLLIAGMSSHLVNRQRRQAESEVASLTMQLADAEKTLSGTFGEVESLLNETVEHLESRVICLDQATLSWLVRGRSICQQFVARKADPVRRALALNTLGHIHYHLHDYKKAEVAYRQALDELTSRAQSTVDMEVGRAYTANHLVHLLATLGRDREALGLCVQTEQRIVGLLSETTDVQWLKGELALAFRNHSVLLAGQNDTSRAIEFANASVEVLDELTQQHENTTQPQTKLAYDERLVDALHLLAGLLWKSDRRQESVAILRQLVDTMDGLYRQARQNAQRQERVANLARYKDAARRFRSRLAQVTRVAAEQTPELRADVFWAQKPVARGRRTVGTEALLENVRLPGEFEKQGAVLFNWTGRDWQDRIHLDMIAVVHPHVAVVILVDDYDAEMEARTALQEAGLPVTQFRFCHVPTNTMWIRDYGPITVYHGSVPFWIDYHHLESETFTNNNLTPQRLGKLAGQHVIRGPLVLEGGNLVGNGQGLLVCTRQLLEDNAKVGFSPEQIAARLARMMGCQQLLTLEPLEREETGHVDWFLTFVSPNVVVVGEYDERSDAVNARILDRNATKLAATQTASGPLRVVRIPMPPHPPEGFGGSYTNVLYANGTLLVPTWDNAGQALNEAAVALYQELLPDWKVVPIDCSTLLDDSAGLRCATMNAAWPTTSAEPAPQFAVQDDYLQPPRVGLGPMPSAVSPKSASVQQKTLEVGADPRDVSVQ